MITSSSSYRAKAEQRAVLRRLGLDSLIVYNDEAP